MHKLIVIETRLCKHLLQYPDQERKRYYFIKMAVFGVVPGTSSPRETSEIPGVAPTT